ncbi:unnamed protein product [Clonostachys rhizophaga]|uniref:Uncharacterized protein n=1 Tax=Clonostachys rhizophaga TaxID=160324 RepID=A0A9N9VK08_9HYPO|nr:unnamed protein product [Clonostachys rhizophaga]
MAKAKRYEDFRNTQHVSHVRGDEGRHWKAVREIWGRCLKLTFYDLSVNIYKPAEPLKNKVRSHL